MTACASFALVVIATALAYVTAFPGAFQYDDWNIVVRNADVHGVAAWFASMPGIRPLTKATLAINWSLSAAPHGFVMFNVLCHAISASLMLALARRWIAALAPDAQRPGIAALVAALTFALHPAQTEAVTYIAGRSVALSACLYLAALYAWERSRGRSPGAWQTGSLALFVAALCARETAWTLPFAIVLVETARGSRIGEALRRARWHLLALVVAGATIAASPTYRRLLGVSLELRGPLENLLAQAGGIAYLIAYPLLTLRLNLDPDIAATAIDAAAIVRALLLLALTAVGVRQLRARPWIGFGVLWFLLHLFPTNGIIARLDLANDRQLYLAMPGAALMLGIALASLRPRIGNALAFALVALLGTATILRNADYCSEVALWEATARVSPGKARVWNNLGVAYVQVQDRVRAQASFERALVLDPAHYKARQNLQDLAMR